MRVQQQKLASAQWWSLHGTHMVAMLSRSCSMNVSVARCHKRVDASPKNHRHATEPSQNNRAQAIKNNTLNPLINESNKNNNNNNITKGSNNRSSENNNNNKCAHWLSQQPRSRYKNSRASACLSDSWLARINPETATSIFRKFFTLPSWCTVVLFFSLPTQPNHQRWSSLIRYALLKILSTKKQHCLICRRSSPGC